MSLTRTDARDAEVEDLQLAVGRDEEIRRLDVAMDDALRMREGQALGHARHDLDLLLERQFTPCEEVRQLLAREQLHHDVRAPGSPPKS